MYRYQYEVGNFDGKNHLSIYDSHGRRHFMTEISDESFQLYLSNEIEFQHWMEETFDDIFETIR